MHEFAGATCDTRPQRLSGSDREKCDEWQLQGSKHTQKRKENNCGRSLSSSPHPSPKKFMRADVFVSCARPVLLQERLYKVGTAMFNVVNGHLRRDSSFSLPAVSDRRGVNMTLRLCSFYSGTIRT